MHKYAVALTASVTGLALAAGLATGYAQAPASVLDGVYTAAQATRGEEAFGSACSGCHEGQDADGPELEGRQFLDRWREDSLETLFGFIKTRMPGNLPGGLDEQVYVDITAYILHANGLPAGTEDLTAGRVARLRLVGPDGPQPLPNLAIVRAVGCLVAQGGVWALERASGLTVVRSRTVEGSTPEELKAASARPLGTQTYPLMSVAARAAESTGHKVQVIGVLTRQGTLDRVNVMSMESVGATCG